MLAAPLSGLYLVYTVSSLAVTAAIPADKAISLACPFQYHNIVTRQAHVEEGGRTANCSAKLVPKSNRRQKL